MSQLTWVPHPVDPAALEILKRAGEVRLGYGDDRVEFAAIADRVTGVLLRTKSMDADQIGAAPRLRIIARHGVGVDTVDLRAADRHQVAVTITANANAQSVAEHALALLLAVSRQVTTANAAVRNGEWSSARAASLGRELSGASLGLLGCGRIARIVARLGTAFGMQVSAFDPNLTPTEAGGLGIRRVDQDRLFATSDVLSLHAPLIESTRRILNETTISALPVGAVVINTARGGLIDPQALLKGLDSGHLAGAGLDVLPEEPPRADDPLLTHERVVITPHIGGQTEQAMRRVATEAATSIVDAYAGRRLTNVVNDPGNR